MNDYGYIIQLNYAMRSNCREQTAKSTLDDIKYNRIEFIWNGRSTGLFVNVLAAVAVRLKLIRVWIY